MQRLGLFPSSHGVGAAVRQSHCLCSRAAGHRWASTGIRHFYQRINEKHLSNELANISRAAHGDPQAVAPHFGPPSTRRPSRLTLLQQQSDESSDRDQSLWGPGAAASTSSKRAGVSFPKSSNRQKPWLHYESLRGQTYPAGSHGGGGKSSNGDFGDRNAARWQDLTHGEAQRLQTMYMNKRMLDRKLLWEKMQSLPNPQKEAKMAIRKQKATEQEAAQEDGAQMYPPPFMDTLPSSRKLEKMSDNAVVEELESRFRNRIRLQKLENARLMKTAVPPVAGVTLDPIKRHIKRRLVRQRAKMQTVLEEVLTNNSAQILMEFLKGVAISIVRIDAPRPRATQKIFYSITSDHDPVWVQQKLEVVAPKLRSQLALKAGMGQTPDIRFVPQAQSQETKRSYLWRFAQAIKREVPIGGVRGCPVSGRDTDHVWSK
eukprot:TRINITY_DN42280_c0_g1_i1.p1 TRINITY_DN42280_c0_g1~~TRINITY_DN42280_c0_g1_i1.p1  ORF type:complete len:430 (-),score=60.71 TRINITY_DN42280_c0_g1_i1:30-1319(-)